MLISKILLLIFKAFSSKSVSNKILQGVWFSLKVSNSAAQVFSHFEDFQTSAGIYMVRKGLRDYG